MHNFDTLFLDRDGVINVKLDGRYVTNFTEFEYMPGARSAISKLTKIFKRIVIITNQQGIGKGVMLACDLELLHDLMISDIEKFSGKINKIYYCPHLVKVACNCRKPQTGMIKKAIRDFPNIIIDDSYLIGDSDSDILAGKSMKLHTVKVDGEYTLAKWTKELMAVL